jgi:hypothetical protein
MSYLNAVRAVGYFLFCLGGFICIVNFYLSFLHYPLYRLKGGQKTDYKWISGFPVLGSVFVIFSIILLLDFWVLMGGIVLITIDTGGFHWFLGSMFYHKVWKKSEGSNNSRADKKTGS